jgi:outer membrane lipoprotein-sorting protein
MKNNEGRSFLRISFNKVKIDEEQFTEEKEEYFFDGFWLVHVNYKLEQVNMYQQTDSNEPIDAFDFISENFPLVGFYDTEKLKDDFELDFRKMENGNISVDLSPITNSRFKDDYVKLVFIIDAEKYIVNHIEAISTEEDIYIIGLENMQINSKMDSDIFKYDIPDNFNVEKHEQKVR